MLIAGLLAAFLGSFSGTLNAAQAYIVNDLFLKYLKPHASNREISLINYTVGVTVVVVSIVFGFFAKDVNTLLQWIVSALYGSYIAANVFKWYWWRFNGKGYFWGMVAGLVPALYLSWAYPGLLPLYLFPVFFACSLVGCLIGTYATRQTHDETLMRFHRSVRPWGFWKPIHARSAGSRWNMATSTLDALAEGARRELLENILPFWRERTVDVERGGFIGEMSNDFQIRPEAGKGLILNARILWTFSAAARFTNDPADRALADRAYNYLVEKFLDRDHGGYFWELDPAGNVVDATKKIYGQAFCAYALGEYHRAFDDPAALQHAIDVFRLIESRSRDQKHGGHWEALSRDWQPIEDVRLSDKDMNPRLSADRGTVMIPEMFKRKLDQLLAECEALIHRHNPVVPGGNGLLDRFQNPVLTAEHTPVFFRYDLDHRTNPHLMERLGINSAFNPGAIELGGTIYLMARVEGVDRKSFSPR